VPPVAKASKGSPRQAPHQERDNERRDRNPARQPVTPFSVIASFLKPLDNFSMPLPQQIIELGFFPRKLTSSHGMGQYVLAEQLKLRPQLGRDVCTAHLPPH
jgi:hypothetical protein